MKKLFLSGLLLLIAINAFSQTYLGAGEYFIDTDPGVGHGYVLSSFATADSVNQTISITSAGLSPGFHRVYLRYIDSNGRWGNTANYLFTVLDTTLYGSTVIVPVIHGEYFVDTDPGAGNGTGLPTFSSADSLIQTLSINTAGLTNGFHRVYLRYRDSLGRWGNTLNYLFSVNPPLSVSTTPSLAAGEYFIDTDPGPGLGTGIASFSSADSVNQSLSISTVGLSNGFHRVYIRYRDSLGKWGNTLNYLFTVNPPLAFASTPPIITGEYFVDTDPGVGLGTSLTSFLRSGTLNQSIPVNTTGLASGFHRVYVRYEDSAGHWGNTLNYLFTVNPTASATSIAPIVAGEYFMDEADPGPGNGTPLPAFVPADSVNQTVSVNTNSLGNGTHSLFMRFMDSTGHWGNISPVVFSVCSTSPGLITGTTILCNGSYSYLSDTTAGGVWSSNNTSVATISGSGLLTAVSAGSALITYAVTTSCGNVFQVAPITVQALAGLAPISGINTICVGASTTLVDTGGVWTTNNAYVATVTNNGVVTGNNGGSAIISYTSTNVCGTSVQTLTMTVNPLPSAPPNIAGNLSACVGGTATLSDAVVGGAWSVNNTAVATISAAGIVTGLVTGSTTISYTVTNGCGNNMITALFAVDSVPAVQPVSGSNILCAGANTQLNDVTGGGNWSTGNTSLATVNSIGYVYGVSAGSPVISYTVTNICGATLQTFTMTINPLPQSPAAITGNATVCAGSTTSLSDISAGGVWSSNNNIVASVDNNGLVTGHNGGTVTISYTETNSCGNISVTDVVTVGQLPDAGSISGTSTICLGSATQLTDATADGTLAWISSNTAMATISSGGLVTGAGSGSVTISYSVTNNCGTSYALYTIAVDTVITSGGIIAGSAAVCFGANIFLTDASAGGSWTVSNTNVAVTNLGLVHGVALGTATVSYTLSNDCGSISATHNISINPLPYAGLISGINSVCLSSPVEFSDAVPGGVWSSLNADIASIDYSSGLVTGLFPGVATILYSVTNSCGTANTDKTIVINPYAGVISGASSVTAGISTTLSETVAGGVWSSSSASVATINSASGLVTGIALGHTTISYTVTGSCGTATDTMSFAVGYCIPAHDSAAASLRNGIIIGKFVFAGLVDSLIDFTRPNGTNNYSDLTSVFTAYASVNSTVICGIRDSLNYVGSAQVYIDFNNDEIFEPSESVGGMASVDSIITAFYVTIPPYADTGMHRMRVIFSYGSGTYGGGVYPHLDPCAVSFYGDVRDYSVDIQNYPFFTGGRTPSVRACQNTPTPVDSVLKVYNHATGDVERWTILSYPYHGTLSGFPYTVTTNGDSIVPLGLSYTGAYEYNGDDEFTVRVYDGTRYVDASVHVVDGISSIVGAIVIDTASSLLLRDSTAGGVWSSGNTVIATINPTTGVATAGVVNGVAIITYSLNDPVCGSIYTTTELPVVAEACYPTFINSTASKTDGVSLQGFAINGELGTYINDFVPSNGTDDYENLDSTFSVTLNKNTTYTVNFPGNQSESIQAWIDYNNDGVFDSTEIVGGGTWPYYNQNYITIGRHVPTGIFRMRVVANAPGYPIFDTTGRFYPHISPCAFSVQYGDGRDYNVIIDSLNHPPHYARTYRVPDLDNICVNVGPVNLDSMLAINDIDSGQTETWTVINPGNGMFSGFSGTMISTGGVIVPAGLTYKPNTGFTGYDNFTIQVSDGFATDVITIGVHVGLPDSGIIAAGGTCNGNPYEVYTGYSCLGLYDYVPYHLKGFDQSYSFPPGVWTSSNTAIVTIGSSSGVVSGISQGTATITYTVTDGCGTTYTTYNVTDIPPPVFVPCDCPPPPPPPPPPPACVSAYFVNGFYQYFTICAGLAKNLDSMLTITDANSGSLTETWYVGAAPSHGTLSGFSYSQGTGGGMAIPSGLTYTPEPGFTGHDAFAIYISNGFCTPYWTYISVLVGPYAGVITGDSVFAMGSPDTLLHDNEPDGIWTSSNGDVADVSIFSIGNNGVLKFVAPGNSIITYTVDNYCGEASVTHPIRVDNDNLYIRGRYVQLGIAPNGSFGSTLDAPADYNANAPDIAYWDPEACYSDTSFRKLGMAYDYGHDGWNTGAPAYFGDYVVHGVPQEGWSVSLDGVTSSAYNYNYQYLCSGYTGWFTTSASHNTGAEYAGGTTTAGWFGQIDSANRHFAITQTTQLDTNASWVLLTTKIVNHGVTVNNVFFNRTISAKNDLGEDGSLITANKISSSLPAGEHMVSSSGTVYNNAYIALATLDSRAKPYIIDSGIIAMDSLAKIWNGTTNYLMSGKDTASAAIGLVYNLGTIGAGDSVSFSYAYIFSDSTGIDSVFANPKLSVNGNLYATSDTVTNCNIHSHATGDTTVYLIAGIVNGDNYTWSWSPSIGLLTDTGISNIVLLNRISGSLIYTVSGTSKSLGDTVKRIFNIVVNTLPPDNTIAGNFITCVGAPDTLADSVTGGVWSSSNTAVATISYSGSLRSLTSGTTTVSYTFTNGCGSTATSATVTVNALPVIGAISGPNSLCVAASIALSDTSAGVWSSAAPGIATVSLGGLVTGLSGGNAIISYTGSGICGSARSTYLVTVIPLPSAGSITGVMSVCTNTTTKLSDGVASGVWSSGNTALATVDNGGLVTGLSDGAVSISYTVTNGCGSTSAFTSVTVVNAIPDAGTITGASTICQGVTVPLSDNVAGGLWSGSNTAVIVTNGGMLTANAGGTATISYTVTNGCGSNVASALVTVNPLPPYPGAIYGVNNVYIGANAELSSATAGGAWSSSNTSVATIDGSGTVSGLSVGTTFISYTVTNGCGGVSARELFNVDPPPGTDTIIGNTTVCAGSTTVLTDGAGGGVWSSNNFSVASVGSLTGIVTGLNGGTAVISYTISGVSVTTTITVQAAPGISIYGSDNPLVCGGSNGDLIFWGFLEDTTYTIFYTRNDVAHSGPVTANNANQVIFTSLAASDTLENIYVQTAAGCYSNALTGPYHVNNPPVPGIDIQAQISPGICSGTNGYLSIGGVLSGNTYMLYYTDDGTPRAVSATADISNRITIASLSALDTISNIYVQTPAGCYSDTLSGLYSFVNPAPPHITIFNQSGPSACGGSDGFLAIGGLSTDTTYVLYYTDNRVTHSGNYIAGAFGQVTISSLGALDTLTNIYVQTPAGCYTNSLTGTYSFGNPPVSNISVLQYTGPTVCGGSNGYFTIGGLTSGASYLLFYKDNGTLHSTSVTAGISNQVTISSLSVADTLSNIYMQTALGCNTETLVGPYSFTAPSPPFIGVFNRDNPSNCGGNNGDLIIFGLTTDSSFTLYYKENNMPHSVPVIVGSNSQVAIGSLSALDTISGIYFQTSTGCFTNTISGTYDFIDPTVPRISITGQVGPNICNGTNGYLNVSGILSGNSYTLYYTDNGTIHSGTVTASISNQITIGSLSAFDTIRNIYFQTAGGCYTDTLAGPYVFSNASVVHVSEYGQNQPTACGGSDGSLILWGFIADTTYTLYYTENGVSHSGPATASNVGQFTFSSLSALDTLSNVYFQTSTGCYTDTLAGPYFVNNPSVPGINVYNQVGPSLCGGSNGYLSIGGLTSGTVYT